MGIQTHKDILDVQSKIEFETDSSTTAFARLEDTARARRIAQLDQLADNYDFWRGKNRYYYDSIARLAKFVIPAGASVLEVGCATGDLLAALEPGYGVGIDLSPRLIEVARGKYPHLGFVVADAETLDGPELQGQTFDYVVIADTLGLVSDVWRLFRALRRVCKPQTRVFVSYYNFVWEPVLKLASMLRLRMPVPAMNWLGMADIENLLYLNGFELVRRGVATLMPKYIPLVSTLLNRFAAHLPIIRSFSLTQYFVARFVESNAGESREEYTCSIIVPCRNERGNIDAIVARTPVMGSRTELIFVDGNSDDGTIEAIQYHVTNNQRLERPIQLIHQGDGTGKGDAVRQGFAAATGDILFILDADLAVPPEDLPKFYAAIREGRAEFVNGSRLVYPMEGDAMRFLNAIGNRFFGWALSSILGQRLKDTLCGTKVFFRRDYERLIETRKFLGDFDPFGDFDLLFGAAKANLKIAEMPIRYRARTYGETKISRFAHGWLLARMTAHAFRKFYQ